MEVTETLQITIMACTALLTGLSLVVNIVVAIIKKQ